MNLPKGHQVDLWYADASKLKVEFDLNAMSAVLSPEERSRHQGFLRTENRDEFLVARLLVRHVLSLYDASTSPGSWRFEANQYGRPSIVGHALAKDLWFNISHSGGFVVCAVSGNPFVGVDVENVERNLRDAQEIADSAYAPGEVSHLANLPETLRHRRFFEIWTLKEAFAKAKGMGLSIGFEKFAFSFSSSTGGEVSIAMDERIAERAEDWSFRLLKPSQHRQIGIALRSPGGIVVKEMYWRPEDAFRLVAVA